MQTQIPPDLPANPAPWTLFLDPFHAPGLAALRPLDAFWQAIPAGRLHGFAIAKDPATQDDLTADLAQTKLQRMFSRAVKVATSAVHLTDVQVRRDGVTQGGRRLLPGPDRLVPPGGMTPDPEADARLADHVAALQGRPGPRHLAVLADDLAPGTPFAIDASQPLFLTLAQLCLVQETGLKGPIYLHFARDAAKTRSFVAALFPELAPRVILDDSPADYAAVVMPYTFTAALCLLASPELDAFEHEFPPFGAWQGRRASRASQAILDANAVDASLFALRARALHSILDRPTSAPKRFWIGPTEGELCDMLRLFGFEAIIPDHLQPLDQIALLAGADMIITTEAVPLALLFASPKTHVITIAPAHHIESGWSDSWPLAALSGCHATTFFVDGLTDAIPRLAVAQIMSVVVALLDKIPTFQMPQDVLTLGQTLMAMGDQTRASAVFETHAALADGHVGLSLAMADLAEARGDHAATLAALYSAYRADPTDWAILVRMLRCARTMNQSDLIGTLLATLHDGFPDRYQAFARARPWTRDFYTTDMPQGPK